MIQPKCIGKIMLMHHYKTISGLSSIKSYYRKKLIKADTIDDLFHAKQRMQLVL